MNKAWMDEDTQTVTYSLAQYFSDTTPWPVQDWQRNMCDRLESLLFKKGQRIILHAPPQTGKPLCDDCLVLMADGSEKPLREIKVGDYVISHRGIPRIVLEVHIQGNLPCIKITHELGDSTVAALDHPFMVSDNEFMELKNLVVGGTVYRISASVIPAYPVKIRDLQFVGDKPCRCLTVDVDKTFIVDTFVVHNSVVVSQRLPSWLLGYDPLLRIRLAAYNVSHAQRFSDINRQNMEDPIYEMRFPSPKSRMAGSNTLQEWSTQANIDKRVGQPSFLALGVATGFTGMGADCFVGETLVDTEYGKMTIQAIHEAVDKPRVFSYNHSTGVVELSKVVCSRKVISRKTITITTKSGKKLSCTTDHRIYANGEYKKAGSLKSGDTLIKIDLSKVRIAEGNHELDVLELSRKSKSSEKISKATGRKDSVFRLWCGIHAEHGFGLNSVKSDAVALVSGICTEEKFVYDIQVGKNNNFLANSIVCHNCFIIDDIYKNEQEASSTTINANIWSWWENVVQMRVNKDTNIIVMMHRWRMNDFPGMLLEKGGWEEIRYPARIDNDDDALVDPMQRTKGQILSPLLDPNLLDRIQKENPMGYLALQQGRPTAVEGNLFTQEMLCKDAELGELWGWPDAQITEAVLIWDTATKTNRTNDFTAGALMFRCMDGFNYIYPIVLDKMIIPEVEKAVANAWSEWKVKLGEVLMATAVEEPSGTAVVQSLEVKTAQRDIDRRKALAGKPLAEPAGWDADSYVKFLLAPPIILAPFTAGSDKITNATRVIAAFRYRRFRLIDTPWSSAWLGQLKVFPQGAHDDAVDATVNGARWLLGLWGKGDEAVDESLFAAALATEEAIDADEDSALLDQLLAGD